MICYVKGTSGTGEGYLNMCHICRLEAQEEDHFIQHIEDIHECILSKVTKHELDILNNFQKDNSISAYT